MQRAKGDRLVRANVLPVCDNAIAGVTLLLHFSDVKMTSFNNVKMADALNIAVLIFLHNI